MRTHELDALVRPGTRISPVPGVAGVRASEASRLTGRALRLGAAAVAGVAAGALAAFVASRR